MNKPTPATPAPSIGGRTTSPATPASPPEREEEQSTESTLIRHWREAEKTVEERKAKEATARREKEIASREADRVRFAHD
jgi:hypothetical protein